MKNMQKKQKRMQLNSLLLLIMDLLFWLFSKKDTSFLDCVSRDYEQNDGFSSANALLDELHFKYLEIQQSKQLE